MTDDRADEIREALDRLAHQLVSDHHPSETVVVRRGDLATAITARREALVQYDEARAAQIAAWTPEHLESPRERMRADEAFIAAADAMRALARGTPSEDAVFAIMDTLAEDVWSACLDAEAGENPVGDVSLAPHLERAMHDYLALGRTSSGPSPLAGGEEK